MADSIVGLVTRAGRHRVLKDPGLTTMHCAPLLLFTVTLKGRIHEVPAARSLFFARRQFYSFSLSDFFVMNIVNFHGSGFDGSVEDEEVDITVEVRSDFPFHVLVPVPKGNGCSMAALFRSQNKSDQNVLGGQIRLEEWKRSTGTVSSYSAQA